jgi:hypothetical protein
MHGLAHRLRIGHGMADLVDVDELADIDCVV